MRFGSVLRLLPLMTATASWAQVDARMLRQPAVSETQIAFVYAGDIWLVPKAGGVAHRLSTPRGEEQLPRFSPGGTQIGYSANYDGNTDVYVIPAGGGTPVRVTHHPAPDGMLGWYPDGKTLAYMPSSRDYRTWKRYRGGWTPDIWLFDLEKRTARNLTQNEANDAHPMCGPRSPTWGRRSC